LGACIINKDRLGRRVGRILWNSAVMSRIVVCVGGLYNTCINAIEMASGYRYSKSLYKTHKAVCTNVITDHSIRSLSIVSFVSLGPPSAQAVSCVPSLPRGSPVLWPTETQCRFYQGKPADTRCPPRNCAPQSHRKLFRNEKKNKCPAMQKPEKTPQGDFSFVKP